MGLVKFVAYNLVPFRGEPPSVGAVGDHIVASYYVNAMLTAPYGLRLANDATWARMPRADFRQLRTVANELARELQPHGFRVGYTEGRNPGYAGDGDPATMPGLSGLNFGSALASFEHARAAFAKAGSEAQVAEMDTLLERLTARSPGQ